MKKLLRTFLVLVSVVFLWIFWIVYNTPGPAEVYDSSAIGKAFSDAAKTNILINTKVEITYDSKRLGTLLWWETYIYFRGDSLSKKQKEQLQILAVQVRKNCKHENGVSESIRFVFE